MSVVGIRVSEGRSIAQQPTPSSFAHGGAIMNYQFHYDRLLDKYGSWEKPAEGYTERHRKFPGYLGGKYVKGNAFFVSARAHYLAHLLWAKITNHEEAWLTVRLIRSVECGKTSKLYERAKLESLPLLLGYLKKARKISGDNAWAQKKGVHAVSKEKRSEWSKAGAKAAKDAKVGIFSAESSQLSEWGKKAGKVRYKCVECGMESTSGALGRHQSSSGHSGRVQVNG